MSIQEINTYYAKGDPKPLGWTFEGRATRGEAVRIDRGSFDVRLIAQEA